MTYRPEEPPRRPFGRRGPSMTTTVTALGLALVLGSGTGVIWGTFFTPAGEGVVINPDFTPTVPTSPVERGHERTTAPRKAPGRVTTVEPTSTPQAARQGTPTPSQEGTQQVAGSSAASPTPCPPGYVADGKGGCLVDHTNDVGTGTPVPASATPPTPTPGGSASGAASPATPSKGKDSGGVAG